MHLTDSELLQLAEPSPGREARQNHIEQCRECRDRLANLRAVRGSFAALPEQKPADVWLVLDKKLKDIETGKLKESVRESKTQVRRWRLASAAIAASFAAFALVIGVQGPNSDLSDAEVIAQLITRSNQLQQTLYQPASHLVYSADVERRLSELDWLLNQAYLNGQSTKTKIALWQQRNTLLTQIQQGQETKKVRKAEVIAI